jgi:trk system potassium uptake protein TrkH
MSVNIKNVIRMMGILLFVIGLCIIPSLIVAIIYQETVSIISFLVTMVICLGGGLAIMIMFPPSLIRIKARDGFLIVSLCWLLASFISAIPLCVSGAIPDFVDAFFETCSGYSTTGSTILKDVESLPRSMLFWRSFTHWLGGMGIIVFATALLPSIGIEGMMIASAETPGPTLDKLTPKFSDTARNLYLLYMLFTAVQTLLLVLGGMSLYDSLLHTFGTVGTGGFSDYNNSVAHFTSPYLQWVIIVFMTMCGTNFNLYFILFKRGPVAMLKDPELRLYLFIMIGSTLLITVDLLGVGGYDDAFKSLTDSAFQVSSIMTTTGYATANYDLWPTFAKMLIFMVMLTGACSSSTGGGPKIIRILVCLKLIRRGVALKIHPNRIFTVTLNGREVPQETTTNIANFMFFYIFTVFAGGLIISLNGFDLITTFSAVITCLGNVGPGFNLVGPVMNFSIFSHFSKFILSLLMIAGRLELFTLFMLLSPHYWNPDKA